MVKQITVDKPIKPNLFAYDDALITTSAIESDFVTDDLEKLAVQLISNNELRVKSGSFCIGGHYGYIPRGTYETCYVAPGNVGLRRKDLIVARYTCVGNIDYIGIQIYTGVPSKGEPVVPTYTVSDLNANGKVREIPLHVVELNDMDIANIAAVFPVRTKKEDINALLKTRSYTTGTNLTQNHFCLETNGIVTDTVSYDIEPTTFTTAKDGVYVADGFYTTFVEIEEGYTATDVIVIPSMVGASSIMKANINSVTLALKPATSIYRYAISAQPYAFISIGSAITAKMNLTVRYKKVKL